LREAAERLDVLALGEPLISLSGGPGRLAASRSLTKSVAGAEANVAIGLARLGLRVGYVSRVGADPFGDEVVRTLRGEGVDVSLVQRSPSRPTGVMVREVRAPDDVRVYYYRQGAAVTELDAVADVPAARHVHVSGITLVLGPGPRAAVHELLDLAEDWGATVSFDPNIRLKLCTLEEAVAACREVLDRVDDLLLSEAEAAALTGAADVEEAAGRLLERGIARVVVRRGAHGALGAAGGERIAVAVADAGPVVDCIGGGDGFTAGYLFERLSGADFDVALRTGAWVAAHVVAHPGDYEGLPDQAEYEAWRAGQAAVPR
jgi:2-dehydro-3-deoxygluconokinase